MVNILKIPKEEWEKIKILRDSGTPLQSIASKYNVTIQCISVQLKRIEARKAKILKEFTSEELLEEIRRR